MRSNFNLTNYISSKIMLIVILISISIIISSQSILAESTCVPKWSCESWEQCGTNSNTPNIISRNCVDLNQCAIPSFTPETTRTCTLNPDCYYQWEATEWIPQECSEDCEQTRSYINKGTCNGESGKPLDEKRMYKVPDCAVTDFEFGEWKPEECPVEGKQTRSYTKNNICNGEPLSYEIEMTCTVPKPILDENIPEIPIDEISPDENNNLNNPTNEPEELADEEIIYEVPDCTVTDFEYREWEPEECPIEGKQTRSYTKNNICNGEPLSSELERTCTVPKPILDKNIPDILLDEDQSINLDLSQYFSGENLIYDFSSEGLANDVRITLDNSNVKIVPNSHFYGTGYIKFTAKNKYKIIESNRVKLIINSVNNPPFIEDNIEDVNIDEDSSYKMDLSNYFRDIDSSLSFTASSNNKNILLSIRGNTLKISPIANYDGDSRIKVIASDEDNSVYQRFNVKVSNIHDPPISSVIPSQIWNEDNINTIKLYDYFSNPNTDTNNNNSLKFTYSIVDNITVEIINGVAILTPNKDFYGEKSILFTATNSYGESISSNYVKLTVNQMAEIENSFVETSQISVNSIVANSVIEDSFVDSSNIYYSFIDPSNIINSDISLSEIIDSNITNSVISNSNIKDMIVSDAVVRNNYVESGTVIFEDETFKGPVSLEFIKHPLLTNNNVVIDSNKIVISNFNRLIVSDINSDSKEDCYIKNNSYSEIQNAQFELEQGKPRLVGKYNGWDNDIGIIGIVEEDKFVFDISNYKVPDGIYSFNLKFSEDNSPVCSGQWFWINNVESKIIKKIGDNYNIVVGIKDNKPYYVSSINSISESISESSLINYNIFKDWVDGSDILLEGNKVTIKNNGHRIWYKDGLETNFDPIGKKIFFTGYHDGWQKLLPVNVNNVGDIILDLSSFPNGRIFGGSFVSENDYWIGLDKYDDSIKSDIGVYLALEKTNNGVSVLSKNHKNLTALDKEDPFIRNKHWVRDDRITINGLRLEIDIKDNVFYKDGNEFLPERLDDKEYIAVGHFDGGLRSKRLALESSNGNSKLVFDFASLPSGVYAFSVVTNNDEWVGIWNKNQNYVRNEIETDGSISYWIVVEKKDNSLIVFNGDKIPRARFIFDVPYLNSPYFVAKEDYSISGKNIEYNGGLLFKIHFIDKVNVWDGINNITRTLGSTDRKFIFAGEYDGWKGSLPIIKEGRTITLNFNGFPDGVYVGDIKTDKEEWTWTNPWTTPFAKEGVINSEGNAGNHLVIIKSGNELKPFNGLGYAVPSGTWINIPSTPIEQIPLEHLDVLNKLHVYIDNGEIIIQDWKDNKVYRKNGDISENGVTFNEVSGKYILYVGYENYWSPREILGSVSGNKIVFDIRGEKFQNGDYPLNLVFKGDDGSEQWFWVDNFESGEIIRKFDDYRIAIKVTNNGDSIDYTQGTLQINNNNIINLKINSVQSSISSSQNQVVASSVSSNSVSCSLNSLYTDFDFFSWAYNIKYVGVPTREYWESRTNPELYRGEYTDPEGMLLDWMTGLWNRVSSRVGEYGGCNNAGVSSSPTTNVIASSTEYTPSESQFLSSDYTDDVPQALRDIDTVLQFLKPLALDFEHPDVRNALSPDQEAVQGIFDLNSIELLDYNARPPSEDDFKEHNPGILFFTKDPEHSEGMYNFTRYMLSWNGQYYVGVEGLTNIYNGKEEPKFYQIGTGILENFKTWAYEDTKFNSNYYSDVWSNYIFNSNEEYNKYGWTEVELLNIKNFNRAKIFHPPLGSDKKPFFIKGRMLDLYEYFEEYLGFPVNVVSINPDSMILENENGRIEYEYKTCEGNSYRINCPKWYFKVKIPNAGIDVEILQDGSVLKEYSDLGEKVIYYAPDIIVIAASPLIAGRKTIGTRIKTPYINQGTAKARFDEIWRLHRIRNKQLASDMGDALKKKYPGRVSDDHTFKKIDDILDKSRHIRDPKARSIVEEFEKALIKEIDDAARRRVILSKDEIGLITKSEIRDYLESQGIKVDKISIKYKTGNGYNAKHVKFQSNGAFGEIQFMTKNMDTVAGWERNIGGYVGKFATDTKVTSEVLLKHYNDARNYITKVYEYADKLDSGVYGPHRIPKCPFFLDMYNQCFDSNMLN